MTAKMVTKERMKHVLTKAHEFQLPQSREVQLPPMSHHYQSVDLDHQYENRYVDGTPVLHSNDWRVISLTHRREQNTTCHGMACRHNTLACEMRNLLVHCARTTDTTICAHPDPPLATIIYDCLFLSAIEVGSPHPP